jgi:hypothetical protein
MNLNPISIRFQAEPGNRIAVRRRLGPEDSMSGTSVNRTSLRGRVIVTKHLLTTFQHAVGHQTFRTMGRWSSDLYRLYVRTCFEQCVYWTSLASKTQMTDVQGGYDEVDFY